MKHKIRMIAVVLVVICVLSMTRASVLGSDSLNAVWETTTVESLGDVGKNISVAISPVNGATYISYYDDGDNSLHAAVYVANGGNCVDGTWQCVFVDGTNPLEFVGFYSDIAIDPTTGYPMIAYYDSSNRRLKYATAACDDMSCPWSTHFIENTPANVWDRTGLYTSLVIGSDGVPQIAFQEEYGFMTTSHRLMYAKYVGNGAGNCDHPDWECTMIEQGVGLGTTPSLDISRNLTPLNNPYIASYDEDNGDLRYAWYLGSGTGNCGGNDWYCLIIDQSGNVGVNPSLSISDGADFGAITYLDMDTGKIKIARTVSVAFPGNCGSAIATGRWQCDYIFQAASAGDWVDISMARTGTNDPIAVFGCPFCMGNGIVQATWVGLGGSCQTNSWDCDVILGDPLSSQDYSQYLDMALSGQEMLTVAFYDATGGDALVSMERDRIYLPVAMLE